MFFSLIPNFYTSLCENILSIHSPSCLYPDCIFRNRNSHTLTQTNIYLDNKHIFFCPNIKKNWTLFFFFKQNRKRQLPPNGEDRFKIQIGNHFLCFSIITLHLSLSGKKNFVNGQTVFFCIYFTKHLLVALFRLKLFLIEGGFFLLGLGFIILKQLYSFPFFWCVKWTCATLKQFGWFSENYMGRMNGLEMVKIAFTTIKK